VVTAQPTGHPWNLAPNLDAMNREPLQRVVTVNNPMGFHFRPIAAFAQLASKYQCNVTVLKNDRRVNGKSAMELMTLAAEQGTQLIVEVRGPDAPAALEALSELLALPSMDDEPDPPLPRKG